MNYYISNKERGLKIVTLEKRVDNEKKEWFVFFLRWYAFYLLLRDTTRGR